MPAARWTAVAVVAASAFLASVVPGQGAVLVVDAAAGPYTSIQAGIDAAADGDTVLVKAGSYQGFAIVGKGLTLAADLGQAVSVGGTFLITGLGASQTAVVRGMQVTVSFVPGVATPPPTVTNNLGTAWVEDCTIIDNNLGMSFSGYPGPGVSVQSSASVVFTRCTLRGSPGLPSGEGIKASSSVVSVHDCMLRGADSAVSLSQPLAGGDGVSLSGGSLFASGSTFQGGKGSVGVTLTVAGQPPICHNGGAGGNGLSLSGSNPSANLLACTFIPGLGGLANTQLGCANAPPGQPIAVSSGSVTVLAGVARHYSATSPVRGNQATSLVFQGPAGEAVWVAWWTAPTNLFLAACSGPLLVGGPPELIALGAMPASGTLTVPILAPDPTPALAGLTAFSQSAFVSGSSAFLGPASAVTLVNSATP